MDVPDHVLSRRVGRGSYGEVWLARNVMGAWRAVKVVRRDRFLSERPFDREFNGIRRYEPISRGAEGLVPVLHVGRDPAAGCFYYVMELADPVGGVIAGPMVDGATARGDCEVQEPDPVGAALDPDRYAPRTLRSELERRGRLPADEVIGVGLALTAGLAHLHRNGLVHRDVKPANIVFVRGRAKLADLGLVGDISESRTFVGTEGYIPPEGPGAPAADLFALGKVLYEAVTGLPPDEFPNPPPDWLTGVVPHDALELHEVVLRACDSDLSRRYRTAAELQADLALLQSGQSVRRARKLERRLRTLRRTGMVAVSAMLLLGAFGLSAAYRARLELANAAKADGLRQRAERAEQVARQRLSEAQLAQAGLERRSGLPGQRFHVLELIREAVAVSTNLAELRTEAIAARALPDLRERRRSRIAGPPGRWCTADAGFDRYTRAEADGSVGIHACSDDREIVLLEGSRAEGLLVWPFSADGRRVGALRADMAYVWDTATGRLLFQRAVSGVSALDLTPDGESVVLQLASGALQLVRLADGSAGPRLDRGFADGAFWFSPDGRRVASFSPSRCEVLLSDADGGSRQTLRLPPPVCPYGLLWTPDSGGLLLAGDDFRGYLFRLGGADLRAIRFEGHQAEIVGGVMHPTLPFALSTSWDGTTRLWELETGRQMLRINRTATEFRWRSDGRLGGVLEHGNGRYDLIEWESALSDGVRVLSEPVPPRALASNKGTWDIAFLAGGDVLAVASYDGIRLWPVAGGEPLLLPLGWTRWLETDPGGEVLWASTAEAVVRVALRWDPAARRLSVGDARPAGAVGRELPLAAVTIDEALSAQGRELFRISSTGVRAVGGLPDDTTRLRASPDGRWLLAGDYHAAELLLLSAPEARLVRRIVTGPKGHGIFLADGADLVVSTATELRREPSAGGPPRWTVPRPGSATSSGPLAIAPDGRSLAAAMDAQQVVLMDGDSGTVWCRLESSERGEVTALRFSPDGRHLAVATGNHTVVLWDLAEVRSGLRGMGLDWSAPLVQAAPVAGKVTFAPLKEAAAPSVTDRTGPLELSGYLTHTLANFSSGGLRNQLDGLVPGPLVVGDIRFEVRGVIQLGGQMLPALPRRVEGLPVNRVCRRLHFLHASAWDGPLLGEIGRYTVRYADGTTEVVLLRHGENIRDWWIDPKVPATPAPVWTGRNPVVQELGMGIGLFHLAWDNPRPDVPVVSLTLETEGQGRLPFLVAVTTE